MFYAESNYEFRSSKKVYPFYEEDVRSHGCEFQELHHFPQNNQYEVSVANCAQDSSMVHLLVHRRVDSSQTRSRFRPFEIDMPVLNPILSKRIHLLLL